MFVARWDAWPVGFSCGVTETVCEVAGGAVHRTAAEAAPAFLAHDPVERAVDDSPVVLVGFGSDQPGKVELFVTSPLVDEALPPLLDEVVDEEPAPAALGCSAVLITAALFTSHQGGTDFRPHPHYCRADSAIGARELLAPQTRWSAGFLLAGNAITWANHPMDMVGLRAESATDLRSDGLH